jgi:hypothetical protein
VRDVKVVIFYLHYFFYARGLFDSGVVEVVKLMGMWNHDLHDLHVPRK